MKKILIVLIILLTACSSESKYKDYNDKIKVPENWASKYGINGDYFTDFESFILIVEENDDLLYTIHKGFNFYRSGEFPLSEKWELHQDSNEYSIATENKNYPIIKGKLVDSEGKSFSISVAAKEEKEIDEILEKMLAK